jgi:hypothetical protein
LGDEDLRHWVDLPATPPNAMITGLGYHHDDRILTAATHGCGTWRLQLSGKSRSGAIAKEHHW